MSDPKDSPPLLPAATAETTAGPSPAQPGATSAEPEDTGAAGVEVEVEEPATTGLPPELAEFLGKVMGFIQALLTSPAVQAYVQARATRASADADYNAAKAETQGELDKLRLQLEHERAMDNQKSHWAFNMERNRLLFRLLMWWTLMVVLLVVGAVYAIHEKILDSQSALTLGVLITGAMGIVTTRVSTKSQQPNA